MTVSAIWQDVRHAARGLRLAPAFSITTAVVLAIGIGAIATTWGVFATVVLDAVPGPYGSRLVAISFVSPSVPSLRTPLTHSAVDELRARTATFDEVASYQRMRPVTLRIGATDREVLPLLVSGRFFSVFGVPPLAGRWLADQDVAHGRDHVAVLSEQLWRDAFTADPAIVGKPVTIDGQAYEVVGVMPSAFGVPRPDVALWIPETISRPEYRSTKARMDSAVARLRNGVPLDEARAYVARLVPGFDRETGEDVRFALTPLRDSLVGPVQRVLTVFLSAVVLVLLIACANAAILLLIRSSTTERDTAIRAALGASTARIAFLGAMEILLLTTGAAIIGLALTAGATAVVRAWGPPEIRRLAELAIDLRAVLVVIACAAGTAFVSGLVPLIRATRAVLDARMRRERANAHLHAAFVLVQAALVVVLAIGAGLLLRSTWKLLTLDPGFDTRNVAAVQFKGFDHVRPDAADALMTDARDAVRAMPGVETASSATLVPGQPGGFLTFFAVERRSGAWRVRSTATLYQSADDQYFHAMGIPVLSGRGFLPTDTPAAPCVAIVNEALAQDAWPGENPLGLRIDLDVDDTARLDPPKLCKIVGVARNARFHLEADPEPFIYFSTHQKRDFMKALVIRGVAGTPVPLTAAIERIHALDPRFEVIWSGPLNDMLDLQIVQPRFYAFLLTSFAVAGLLLAGAGVYGAAAYGVARRRREIGVRIALGARGIDVARTIVGGLAAAVLVGIAAGTVASVFASAVLQSLLFEVRAHDAITFAAAPGTIALAVLAATLPAARRAARVNPAELLREE